MDKESVLATIREVVRNIDSDGSPHDQIVEALTAHGFICMRECRAPYYRRNGCTG